MEPLVLVLIVVGIGLVLWWYLRQGSTSQSVSTSQRPTAVTLSRSAPTAPPKTAKKLAQPLPPDPPVTLGGDLVLGVAGEYYHRAALNRITGRRVGTIDCAATLEREPTNRYDANAIKVTVRGQHIGYLAKTDSPSYQPMMRDLEAQARPAVVRARIEAHYDNGELDTQAVLWMPRL
jgi:hypothetical protein